MWLDLMDILAKVLNITLFIILHYICDLRFFLFHNLYFYLFIIIMLEVYDHFRQILKNDLKKYLIRRTFN